MDLNVKPWDLDSSVQVLHLRLTDACLAALEKNANSSTLNLEIKATSPNTGVMRFENDSEGFSKEFGLTYNSDSQNKDAPLQIIRLKSKLNKAEDLGTLDKRLTVNANDEVFEDYSKKITALEENSKQKSAKELKPYSQSQNVNQVIKAKRLQNANNAATNGSGSAMMNRIKGSLNSNRPASSSQTKPANTQSSVNISPKTRQPAQKDFSSVPIHTRIIQTLAIRPYKRSDLLARFTLEGLLAKEKAKMDSILQRVTCTPNSAQSADSKHAMTLKSEYIKTVDPNWSFYTPVEKQLVVRNLEKSNLANSSKNSDNATKNHSISIKSEPSTNNEKPKPKLNNNHHHNNAHGQSESNSISSNLLKQNSDSHASKLTKNNSKSSSSLSSSSTQISHSEYKKYVAEYEDIYPLYEKLYAHIMRIKEQYKGYRRQVLELSEASAKNGVYTSEDEIDEKLMQLKHLVETESECLGAKFAQDLEKQKKMHSRILYLKGAIKSYVRSHNLAADS